MFPCSHHVLQILHVEQEAAGDSCSVLQAVLTTVGKITETKLHKYIASFSLQILHVEQEVVGDNRSVLQAVLDCDSERSTMLKVHRTFAVSLDEHTLFRRCTIHHEHLQQSSAGLQRQAWRAMVCNTTVTMHSIV